jgi:hypothetical protein
MGLFRKKKEVLLLQISETELAYLCLTLQNCFPDEIVLERDGVILHSSLLRKSVDNLLQRSVKLGDQKLFAFVISVCYSASDELYKLKPDEIAKFLSDDFHLYLHVFHYYHADEMIREDARSLIQAYRIKLDDFSGEQEVLEYFSTRDSELYMFLDDPISESFNDPANP